MAIIIKIGITIIKDDNTYVTITIIEKWTDMFGHQLFLSFLSSGNDMRFVRLYVYRWLF